MACVDRFLFIDSFGGLLFMVVNATSFSANGLRDWLIQRFSAVILGVFTFFMLGYFLCHHGMDYASWHVLFAYPAMKIFTVLTLVSLAVHAYIGMWTITTDYIKVTSLRLITQLLVVLILFIYFIWGTAMLWSFK